MLFLWEYVNLNVGKIPERMFDRLFKFASANLVRIENHPLIHLLFKL